MFRMFLSTIYLVLLLSLQSASAVNDTINIDLAGMKGLLSDTLSRYDRRVRPLEDQYQVVKVNSHLIPLSLIDFDTSEQSFSILGYFRISWVDEIISWNSSDYGGTNFFKIPVSNIWMPGLIISKSFDGDGFIGDSSTDMVKVHANGTIQWIPEGIFSVVCDVDIRYYPFDKQICTISYYVIDETVSSVELDHNETVTLDEYSENSAWWISDVSRRCYTQSNISYVDVEFKLKRRSSFAIFTLVMPLVMLAFLNICMFLVPIGSGEKGSFAITIFLAYGIFVTIISDTLPDNSLQTCYFLLFIITLLMTSVLSVLYTIIQSLLMATIGDKNCSIKLFRRKCTSSICAKNSDDVSSLGGAQEETNSQPNKKRESLKSKNSTFSMDSAISMTGIQVSGIKQPSERKKSRGFTEATKEKAAGEKQKRAEAEKKKKEEAAKAWEDEENDEDYTWGMFLETLDVVVFLVFFVVITFFTVLFFGIMLANTAN